MNNKQVEEKQAAKCAMRKIMEEYDINNTKRVRYRLADDYSITVSDSTVKRYRKEIREEDKLNRRGERKQARIIAKKKSQETKSVKAAIKKDIYPIVIKDPAGKPHKIQSAITSVGLFWKHEDGQGDYLVWGPAYKYPFWHWESNGTVYGKKSSGKILAGFAKLTHEND